MKPRRLLRVFFLQVPSQTVAKRRESTRGFGAARIPIVAGGRGGGACVPVHQLVRSLFGQAEITPVRRTTKRRRLPGKRPAFCVLTLRLESCGCYFCSRRFPVNSSTVSLRTDTAAACFCVKTCSWVRSYWRIRTVKACMRSSSSKISILPRPHTLSY